MIRTQNTPIVGDACMSINFVRVANLAVDIENIKEV